LEVNFLQSEEKEMKKFILALFVCLAVTAFVVPVYASELWDPHLHALDEGLAAGALPPPGLYFIETIWMTPEAEVFDSQGHKEGLSLGGAFVDVPALLWVPGVKFLNADYGMVIAQPFDYSSLRIKTTPPGSPVDTFMGGQQWGTFNTIIVPYILAWRLPCDFHIKTDLAVGIKDAMSSPGDAPGLGGPYAGSGNGTWMFTPSVGVSWLHAGWNASAAFFYSFQTKNTNGGESYESGDEFAADYTLTYTCGKWTFGAGAAQEQQLFNDKSGGVTLPGTMNRLWSAGPILGYNFGPCSLMIMYNWDVMTKNDVGGEWFNARLIVPLGNLCPLGK
jgi:hypothetical protein